MDLRDNIREQLEQHIGTLRVIAKQETPPLLIWQEIQRVLTESATHLELHMLPKIEVKPSYLDLHTGEVAGAKLADYVPEGVASLPERPTTGGFLRASGPRSEAMVNGNASAEVEA